MGRLPRDLAAVFYHAHHPPSPCSRPPQQQGRNFLCVETYRAPSRDGVVVVASVAVVVAAAAVVVVAIVTTTTTAITYAPRTELHRVME